MDKHGRVWTIIDESEPIPLDIDGSLDLHAFRPAEIKQLIPDYLGECRRLGILQVRIVHGKGSGSLRRTVHALLERLKRLEVVASFRLGDETSGSWGATLVSLRPAERPGPG